MSDDKEMGDGFGEYPRWVTERIRWAVAEERERGAKELDSLKAQLSERFTEAEVRRLLGLIDWDGYISPECRVEGEEHLDRIDLVFRRLREERKG